MLATSAQLAPLFPTRTSLKQVTLQLLEVAYRLYVHREDTIHSLDNQAALFAQQVMFARQLDYLL
jgi:hypothetical protein